MNPLVWVAEWCNQNHIALNMTALAASANRMLVLAVDYNASHWTPSDSRNIFVNTFLCVGVCACAHSSRRKMREKVLI